MEQKATFYECLQVSSVASYEVISSAYRTLMSKLKKHPDLGGETSEAAEINKAYETLSDPVKRSDYDLELLRQRKQASEKPEAKKEGIERRRATRHDSNKLVSYCLDNKTKWIPALVRDTSTMGVRLQSHEPIFEGESITISPSNMESKSFKGTVRWTRMFHPSVFERVYEVGVEFPNHVVDIDQRLSV